MTTNHSRGRERHDRGTLLAGLIALTALAAAVLLAISLAPASAETPAERCKRETTAYNNAWKNSWAASHPGKKPSDAPKPPVPYKCGGNNDGPPPTVQPTTTTPEAPSETTAPPTTAPGDSSGPNLNAPTERREIEHPGPAQSPIGSVQPTHASSARTATPPDRRVAIDYYRNNFDIEDSFDDKCGNRIVLRTGYYDSGQDRGFGQDKAEHKHNITNTAELLRWIADQECAEPDGGTRQKFVTTIYPKDCTVISAKELLCKRGTPPVTVITTHDSRILRDGKSMGVITMHCLDYGRCPDWINRPPDFIRSINGAQQGDGGTMYA